MGIIYAYPSNEQKDYRKSLECFQKILKDYPESRYRQDSAEMISHINNVTIKDKKIIAQQTQIETLEREVKTKEDETLRCKRLKRSNRRSTGSDIGRLHSEREPRRAGFLHIQNGPAYKILIEKKERRLTLISKDKVLKRYRIALGGDPNGPKERKGDNKTPEGIYFIDSRNRNSRYHLSLHISYPNEKDKKRAKELGVSPGGDIMIHGIKNGFSWIGDTAHGA